MEDRYYNITVGIHPDSAWGGEEFKSYDLVFTCVKGDIPENAIFYYTVTEDAVKYAGVEVR